MSDSTTKRNIYYTGVGCRDDHHHTEQQLRVALRDWYPGDIEKDQITDIINWSGANYTQEKTH